MTPAASPMRLGFAITVMTERLLSTQREIDRLMAYGEAPLRPGYERLFQQRQRQESAQFRLVEALVARAQ